MSHHDGAWFPADKNVEHSGQPTSCRGHTYQDLDISGNAQAHLGDTNNMQIVSRGGQQSAPPSVPQTQSKHDQYKVGWICTLPTEMAAAVCVLDERHPPLLYQSSDDHNSYVLGRIGRHNVVVACLPAGKPGMVSASRVASQMRSTFKSIRFGFMVGIGGGVPSKRHDIRLGDVVVSKPNETSGGVIQYDFGKALQDGRFMRVGSLNRPPDVLLNAVLNLQAQHMYEDNQISQIMAASVARYPRRRLACTCPGASEDLLFESSYSHELSSTGEPEMCQLCCDASKTVSRPTRTDPESPIVHYGLVASGNKVVRDSVTRERLQKELDVLCIEMEAAGLMDDFPCLVVRGICNYSDSHKNKRWQDYAAATAAAYTKELLGVIPGDNIPEAPQQNHADKNLKERCPSSPSRPLDSLNVGFRSNVLLQHDENASRPLQAVTGKDHDFNPRTHVPITKQLESSSSDNLSPEFGPYYEKGQQIQPTTTIASISKHDQLCKPKFAVCTSPNGIFGMTGVTVKPGGIIRVLDYRSNDQNKRYGLVQGRFSWFHPSHFAPYEEIISAGTILMSTGRDHCASSEPAEPGGEEMLELVEGDEVKVLSTTGCFGPEYWTGEIMQRSDHIETSFLLPTTRRGAFDPTFCCIESLGWE